MAGTTAASSRAPDPTAAASAQTGSRSDGLDALIHFARRAAGADVLLAFEAGNDGLAKPQAASPENNFMPFDLRASRLYTVDWSQGPVAVERLNLPCTILATLERPAREAWFLPAPVVDAPNSGMLFIWLSNPPPVCECTFRFGIREQVGLLGPVFAQMLNDRSAILRKRRTLQRFQDLLGSVPNGVVIIEGHGQSGLINEQMAALFECTAGEKTVDEIAGAMRALRERCINANFLTKLYGPLQRSLDLELRAVWDLGELKLEVDTHPILGSGRNGRIWLFHDVTAQHIVDENLRRMALTDALTGLPNRRYFFDAGEALLAAPPSETGAAEPVAALMLDIDFFKAINDRYGHQAGDEVLREVAVRLKAMLRHEDHLARLGGEEFAVLISGLSAAGVVEVAERLRLAVAAAPVTTTAGDIEVRLSIGVAQLRDDESLRLVLQRADKALYAAKAGGRNRVVSDLLADQENGL
jgi:diguanylate cyclase (GGDEF)-like protein